MVATFNAISSVVGGPRLRAPRVPRLNIPRVGKNTQPSIPGQRISAAGGGEQTIVIPISIGQRKIEEVVVSILNGQIRTRAPGLLA